MNTHLVAADPCAVEPSGGELAVHGVLQLHPPPIYDGIIIPVPIVDLGCNSIDTFLLAQNLSQNMAQVVFGVFRHVYT